MGCRVTKKRGETVEEEGRKVGQRVPLWELHFPFVSAKVAGQWVQSKGESFIYFVYSRYSIQPFYFVSRI